MSNLTAPQQADRIAWGALRIGNFSGSTNGKLMSEPRSKAAKEAGELSDTAKTLIATKALEVIKQKEVRSPWSWDMKRGYVLEAAMKYLLTKYWEPVFDCTMQRNGVWLATPDGLKGNGEPLDIKNTNEVDLMLFADQVPDGNWQALKKWNKDYAYQILTQAQACGTTHASLIYCTDQIKAIPLDHHDILAIHGEGLHDELGGLIGDACQRLLNETGSQFTYQFHDAFGEPGFAFIARRFEIPTEEIEAMENALIKAYDERDKAVIRFRGHVAIKIQEASQTEAVAELVESADVAPPPTEVERMHGVLKHAAILKAAIKAASEESESEMAKQTYGLCQRKAEDVIAMLQGTITKDLK